MSRISTATVHIVRACHEWAVVALDDVTGLIAIQSSYGAFVHIWPPHYRSEPLDIFVSTCDFGYFMGKARGNSAQEFDLEETILTFRRDVVAERRHGNLSREMAREAWTLLDDILNDPPLSADRLSLVIEENWDVLGAALGCDYYDGFRKRYTPECTYFWSELWPAIVTAIWCADGLENPMAGA